MKTLNKIGAIVAGFSTLMIATVVYVTAATTPPLDDAHDFGILASTYTNTVSGTTITGDLGYTTGPAEAPIVNGTTFVGGSPYNQAGTDQGIALAALDAQACTFSFAPGAINLATDTTHGGTGVYNPGVYCVDGAASIGTAGITLSGAGTFIFRIDGALTTVDNSVVSLSNGSSECDVWWTPSAATTLGADTTFIGTVIDDAGITLGNLAVWIGRALSFGGTVTTSRNSITVPTCPLLASSSSNGGSSSSIQIDVCVNGDNSPSEYDGICSRVTTTTTPDVEEEEEVVVDDVTTDNVDDVEAFEFENPSISPLPLEVTLPAILPQTGSTWNNSSNLRKAIVAISLLLIPCLIYMMPRRKRAS